jgi:hypothetical protein
MEIYIYAGAGFVLGFLVAWIIRSITVAKLAKLQKSTQGFLESEKLMKETLQKENLHFHQVKLVTEREYAIKLKEAEKLNKILDEDILLLQKSNEETEALLEAGEPALHQLKLKLIEANNMIARYKAQLEIRE